MERQERLVSRSTTVSSTGSNIIAALKPVNGSVEAKGKTQRFSAAEAHRHFSGDFSSEEGFAFLTPKKGAFEKRCQADKQKAVDKDALDAEWRESCKLTIPPLMQMFAKEDAGGNATGMSKTSLALMIASVSVQKNGRPYKSPSTFSTMSKDELVARVRSLWSRADGPSLCGAFPGWKTAKEGLAGLLSVRVPGMIRKVEAGDSDSLTKEDWVLARVALAREEQAGQMDPKLHENLQNRSVGLRVIARDLNELLPKLKEAYPKWRTA